VQVDCEFLFGEHKAAAGSGEGVSSPFRSDNCCSRT
jgi:hypothetical protein